VNLGNADWLSPISEGDRVLMSSAFQIKASAGSICLPPSSVVILETPAPDA
jgi:hypothetical protein